MYLSEITKSHYSNYTCTEGSPSSDRVLRPMIMPKQLDLPLLSNPSTDPMNSLRSIVAPQTPRVNLTRELGKYSQRQTTAIRSINDFERMNG